jgi:hypothetical protein
MVERAEAQAAADTLSAALERSDFVGWDPYDALASPTIRALARTPMLRQAAIQGLKTVPFNPRRVLGVPPTENPKALALFVSAYARLAKVDPVGRYSGLALALGERLEGHAMKAGGGAGAGWAYPFDVQTRWGYYPRTRPNAVVTTFAAHALMDVEELAPPGRFVPAVDSALEFARSSLTVEQGGESYFAYYEGSKIPIHNASLLVASLFARRGRPEDALPALRYSLQRQRPDGSWPYGDRSDLGWVDGYHTAFVLWSLQQALSIEEEAERSGEALDRALDYFLARFVDPDGAIRASPDSRYPVDIHSCASSVWALSALHERDRRALPTAGRVLGWTLAHMRREDGRFAFQRRRLMRASVPYARWSDGHMLLALAEYVTASG